MFRRTVTDCMVQNRNVHWSHGHVYTRCHLSMQIYDVQVTRTSPELLGKGLFETVEELNSYEQMWHEMVFTEAFTNLRTDVRVDRTVSTTCVNVWSSHVNSFHR